MNRKITFLFLSFLNLVLAFTLGSCTNQFYEPGKVEVTDMLGTKIYVKKIQVRQPAFLEPPMTYLQPMDLATKQMELIKELLTTNG